MRALITATVFILSIGSAHADEPEYRELITCQPGKVFSNLADTVTGLDEDLTNTIHTNPSFTFAVLDGGVLPSRIFYRSETGEEKDLPFSDKGEVTDIVEFFEDGEKAQFCVEDPTRAGQIKDGDTYSVSMQMKMRFINSSGTYALGELEDGIKDGNSILSKLYGGPAALSVLGFEDIHVAYQDKSITPDFQGCTVSGNCQTVPFEKFEGNYIVAFETLKDMNASELRVVGGAHSLSPTMSYEKVLNSMN